MADFGAVLVKLRREAGFPTAYRFYHGNGGKRHFPFTYVHYLRIERGRKLPRPEWFGRLVSALRLAPGPAGRELYLSYLKGLLKTEEAYGLILAPLISASAPARRPAGAEAMRWLKAQHSKHLTPEQFRVLSGSEAAYWCSEALFNETESLSAAEIASTFALSEKAAAAGLQVLEKAGMARKTSTGRYRSRWPGKFFTFPGRLEGMKSELESIAGFWEKMYRRRGRPAGERVELVRAEAESMRQYTATLAETLDTANALATHSRGEATGLFLIEARVRKLIDY